ncbi:glucosaminidase domain-containing protein [Paenibacillus sp. NEAU-GSW1]|uniref:glucosaminidase domain-containing protein n=1 Tax=Paenibacillus sp. NEAU-GSW1 TaxID=2682486 RepID=UPI0012E2CAEF|nr:glucosaminidase domain-containing protein [Paenibacillus sp. NEAU-GSW1]MUT67366.1 hypothetical protein [Paenibacillus sp. NEAU-GSW1]
MAAEEAYVLSPNDISKIRRYVQHKYAEMPHERKVEIVADAVGRIIHKQLPEFEIELKKQLTAALIRTVVVERQVAVRTDDIFEVCLNELDRTDKPVIEQLRRWTEQHLNSQIDSLRFVQLLDELTCSTDLAQVEGALSWQRLKERIGDERKRAESGSDSSSPALADVIALPVQMPHSATEKANAARVYRPYVYGLLCLLLIGTMAVFGWSMTPFSGHNKEQPKVQIVDPEPVKPIGDGLPAELRYTQVDKQWLASFLESKSSILAEKAYMNEIIASAEAFDIHPLLLFAITGQEQAFVPKTNKYARKIANNPFNVFHSWKEYNTTIRDSADIASRTIVRLSKNRPEQIDPITWINREYAEDPNWSKGVSTIFASMKRQMETTSQTKEAID